MAFSLHNHCLCRVGVWSRISHARLTPDVRNLTGMQHSSRAVFSSILSLVATKEEQRSARTCTRSWNWSAESKVYCRDGAALHCRWRLSLRGNLPNICCLLKHRLNHRQASRNCLETLSKCSWHEPRATRPTHTLSLFCFCVLGRSKFTKQSLTLQEKLCIFSFESATSWFGDLDLVAALSELSLGCSVFSGSDSFSRIWSQREGGGGGGQRLNRTYRWRELRFQ